MTDLVERLREACPSARDYAEETYNRLLLREAANEIERLRAQVRELTDRPRDDGTAIAVGGEPGASAGKSE